MEPTLLGVALRHAQLQIERTYIRIHALEEDIKRLQEEARELIAYALQQDRRRRRLELLQADDDTETSTQAH